MHSSDDGAEFRKHLTDKELVRLIEAFGGQRVYIPSVAKQFHRLTKAIGLPAAKRLGDAMGTGTWRVPMARDFRIRYYLSKGVKNRAIARRIGLTENGLARAIKRLGLDQ